MIAQELHDRTCGKKIASASVSKLDTSRCQDRSEEITYEAVAVIWVGDEPGYPRPGLWQWGNEK